MDIEPINPPTLFKFIEETDVFYFAFTDGKSIELEAIAEAGLVKILAILTRRSLLIAVLISKLVDATTPVFLFDCLVMLLTII